MFKDIVKQIEQELSFYKRDKNVLLKHYIQTRLEESVVTYYSEINEKAEHLSYIDDSNKLRKILDRL